MKIIIAMPSKGKNDPFIVEGMDYLARLRSPLSAQAIFLSPQSQFDEAQAQKRMELEAEDLLKRTEGHIRIALTERGKMYSSVEFARYMASMMNRAPKVAFLIGGAFGLAESAIARCEATLSLSPMTLPHRLAFLMLCEQIYRAGEIHRGTAYHK